MNADAIVRRLDALIRESVPEASSLTKYGGTLYTLKPDEKEGQFCGVFPYERHVQLSFTRGSELDDPGGMLAGGGKHRRHLNFAAEADIPVGDVRGFVRAASRIG